MSASEEVRRPAILDKWALGIGTGGECRKLAEYAKALEGALWHLWKEEGCECKAPGCVRLASLVLPLVKQIPPPKES